MDYKVSMYDNYLDQILSINTFIYRYNSLIPRGILGIVVIYLIYKNGFFLEKESFSVLFEFPRNLKYFFYAILGGSIAYWAFQEIFFMVVLRK